MRSVRALVYTDARPLARALAAAALTLRSLSAKNDRECAEIVTRLVDERPISARIAEIAPRSSRLVDEALIRTAAAAGRRVAAAYESADRRDHRPIRLHVGLNSALDTS